MSMLEIQRSALEEVIVPYHTFLMSQSKSKKRLYGFVEGKDDPSYYQGRIISQIRNDEWEVILIEAGHPKGNKNRVLRLLNIIDWNRFSPKQTTFFVDRDLSDFLDDLPQNDNLYITDEYSIENNIVTVHTLKRALIELFNIHLVDYEFDIVVKFFEQGIQKIAYVAEIITCYYLFLRKKGLTPSLGDIDISEIIRVNKCIVDVKSLEAIKRYIKTKWCYDYDELCIKEIQEDFSEKNKGYKYVRGKYLMWYFIKFINSFCCTCNEIIPSMDKPITGYRELSEKYAIQDLGPRSKTPCSLNEFIERTYMYYIKEFAQCS
ncbi:DUF4435 domain-containing protein [Desulfoscipio sp. XC116]|uniref:DUF4435 domain-containing protein n=1 Tax=Desulfoscipio sp. XC116 TaxID=3144975 RepID=UPI00325C1498